jgi:diacylglycerol O-acyltransferase 1
LRSIANSFKLNLPIQYGNLICLACHNFQQKDVFLGLSLYIAIPVFLFIALAIEYVAARQAEKSRTQNDKQNGPTEDQIRRFRNLWNVIAYGHTLNMLLLLGATTYCVYFHIHHPLIGTPVELHAIIVSLKIFSYALTNRDLRHAYLHATKEELKALPQIYRQCPYPTNISIKNLAYFWWAPTLVYQPVYPRSSERRWLFIAKRLGEIAVLSAFIWICTAQYAAPLLHNSVDKWAAGNYVSIVERLLKLSTISLVIWLAGFFALFQSFLNALAEVMMFGDRCFYDDWWNSESFGTYWRTWNKPVYSLFKRHVYLPLVNRGWKGTSAGFMVFLASAILHEALVGVPTHDLSGKLFPLTDQMVGS